jgi:hypothetical protein
MPPTPTDKPAIVTRAQKQAAERKAITGRRRELAADPANALVDPIRRQNSTAVSSQWRDPEDRNVLRKTPKTISGFRADDPVDRLLASQTINRGQAWAARRLRIDFERGNFNRKAVLIYHAAAAAGLNRERGPPSMF